MRARCQDDEDVKGAGNTLFMEVSTSHLMLVIIAMAFNINPANGSTNSTLFGGGTKNSTLFCGGTNNSTLFGGGTNNATLFGGGTINSTLLGGGNNNSTLFGGGTNNSTRLGGGTNNETLFGGGTNNSTRLGGGTNNATLFGGETNNSTLFGGGNNNSTLFGGGNNNSKLFGGGTINSTLFGGLNNNSTLFGGGTINSTLFGGETNNSTLFGGGTINSTRLGGGNNNSTLFGGGTINSTLFGGGTNNSTLFGGGTINSTLIGGGTNNSTRLGGETINSTLFGGGTFKSTLFGGGTTKSTLFGGGTTKSTLFGEGIAKLYHQGIINSTLFGEGTSNQTPFNEETANWTLLGGEDFVIEDVSDPPISEMTIVYPWLPYTMVTFACLFLLVGLFGNGITLVVTLKSETRFKPHNILIMSLAVADTLALLTNTLNVHAFSEVSLIDMQALKSANVFTCKLFNATYRMSLLSSTLIIMLICIERFIVVWFPLKARHLLTKRLTIISVVACVMTTLVISGIPSALYSGNVNGECYFGLDVDDDGEGDTMQTTPLLMIMPILFVVTPMLVILSLTPLTIAKLYYQQAIRRSLTNQETSTGTHRTSVLLTAVVVVYLLLAGTPYLLFTVMSVRGTLITTAIGSWGVGKLFLAIIVQANYSTNFILYTVFNKEFRQNLFRMLGCSCC